MNRLVHRRQWMSVVLARGQKRSRQTRIQRTAQCVRECECVFGISCIGNIFDGPSHLHWTHFIIKRNKHIALVFIFDPIVFFTTYFLPCKFSSTHFIKIRVTTIKFSLLPFLFFFLFLVTSSFSTSPFRLENKTALSLHFFSSNRNVSLFPLMRRLILAWFRLCTLVNRHLILTVFYLCTILTFDDYSPLILSNNLWSFKLLVFISTN